MTLTSYKDVVRQEAVVDTPVVSNTRDIMHVEHPSQIYTLLENLKHKTHEQQHTWQLLEQAVQETLVQAKRYYGEFGILDGMTNSSALANTFVKYAKLETPNGTILTATHMDKVTYAGDAGEKDSPGQSNPLTNPEEAMDDEE